MSVEAEIEALIRDRDALEAQIEKMDGEINELKGRMAILTATMGAIRWNLEMGDKQIEARRLREGKHETGN